jgi:hypothetical protein
MQTTRLQLALRTFGWAAVGFLVTSGAVVALGTNFDAGNYEVGMTALALSLVAAVVAGVIAALQSLKFPATTAIGKAAAQFVQMVVAGLGVLVLADLTDAAVVAFVGAIAKLVVASLIGALQAYLVNLPRPPEQPPAV